jgi:hypothetical protein
MGRRRGNAQELVHQNIYNIAAVEAIRTFQVFTTALRRYGVY